MSGQVTLQPTHMPRGVVYMPCAAPVRSPYTVSTQSTMSSQNPRNAAKTDLSDCLSNVWEAIVSFFKSLMNCFGLFSRPVAVEPSGIHQRELRLHKNDVQIRQSLNDQMAWCRRQMIDEPVKQFRLINSMVGLSAVQPEETRVGSYEVGISHFIGYRDAMEDEHLATSFDLVIGDRHYPIQLFGIFDGHGGPLVARYMSDNLRRKLNETLYEFNRAGLTEAGIWKALKMTFVRLNEDLKNLHGQVAYQQGSTATVAMILDNKLWTANVGDSRTCSTIMAQQSSYLMMLSRKILAFEGRLRIEAAR